MITVSDINSTDNNYDDPNKPLFDDNYMFLVYVMCVCGAKCTCLGNYISRTRTV